MTFRPFVFGFWRDFVKTKILIRCDDIVQEMRFGKIQSVDQLIHLSFNIQNVSIWRPAFNWPEPGTVSNDKHSGPLLIPRCVFVGRREHNTKKKSFCRLDINWMRKEGKGSHRVSVFIETVNKNS